MSLKRTVIFTSFGSRGETTKFRNTTTVVTDLSPNSVQKTKFKNQTVVSTDLSPGFGQVTKFKNKTAVIPAVHSGKDTVPTSKGIVHFPLRS